MSIRQLCEEASRRQRGAGRADGGGRLAVAQTVEGAWRCPQPRNNAARRLGILKDLREVIRFIKAVGKPDDCNDAFAARMELGRIYSSGISAIYAALRPRNANVVSATRLPRARAIIRSSAVGCNSPFGPAIVDAP